jgi:hypothetical protein
MSVTHLTAVMFETKRLKNFFTVARMRLLLKFCVGEMFLFFDMREIVKLWSCLPPLHMLKPFYFRCFLVDA